MTAHPMTAGESRFEAQEHRDLALGLSHIDDTIGRASELGSEGLWARLHDTLRWLDRDVRAHMAWEDRWLYPQIDEIAGTPMGDAIAPSRAPSDRDDDRQPRGGFRALAGACDAAHLR